MTELSHYRNIGIFAHVDAGKTTTTERILKLTGKIHKTVKFTTVQRPLTLWSKKQERGITIQSRCNDLFLERPPLNIIDTPGHVDFHGRSLSFAKSTGWWRWCILWLWWC